jgi:hypothetical protein
MAKLSDFQTDPNNLNKGTQRGVGRLEKSLQDYGFGRPILAARDGTIVAGNHTLEAAVSLGLTKVKVVETSGDEVIIHKRMDLDPEDTKTKLLGLADNRISQLNWNVDVSGLAELAAMDDRVMDFYSKNELDLLQGLVEAPAQATALPVNPPMATTPEWAKGTDDEEDDEDPDVRWPGEMPEDDDDEDAVEEADDFNEAAKASRALPIVLNAAEYRSWRKAKDQLGVERDKVALLKLVQRYLEEIEPAASSELS